jgi:hypothetical protein
MLLRQSLAAAGAAAARKNTAAPTAVPRDVNEMTLVSLESIPTPSLSNADAGSYREQFLAFLLLNA